MSKCVVLPIGVFALRPPPFYPKLIPLYEDTNALLLQYAEDDPWHYFIDANAVLRAASGEWRKDLHQLDHLHLNDVGNKLWLEAIKQQLLPILAEHDRQVKVYGEPLESDGP